MIKGREKEKDRERKREREREREGGYLAENNILLEWFNSFSSPDFIKQASLFKSRFENSDPANLS